MQTVPHRQANASTSSTARGEAKTHPIPALETARISFVNFPSPILSFPPFKRNRLQVLQPYRYWPVDTIHTLSRHLATWLLRRLFIARPNKSDIQRRELDTVRYAKGYNKMASTIRRLAVVRSVRQSQIAGPSGMSLERSRGGGQRGRCAEWRGCAVDRT